MLADGDCNYGENEDIYYYDVDAHTDVRYICQLKAHSNNGLCEFHDKDYAKSSPDALRHLMIEWFGKEERKTSPLLCIGFHFPPGPTFQSKFKMPVYFNYAKLAESNFNGAEFESEAYFKETHFESGKSEFSIVKGWVKYPPRVASFANAKFKYLANFEEAKFKSEAYFSEAEFEKGAYFKETHFESVASFANAKFGLQANFANAKFKSEAEFSEAEFYSQKPESEFKSEESSWIAISLEPKPIANFSGSEFHSYADFSDAKFKIKSNFSGAKFQSKDSKAEFLEAEFYSEVNFSKLEFQSEADFRGAKFNSKDTKADFSKGKFHSTANFSGSEFNPNTDFSETEFYSDAYFVATNFQSKDSKANFVGTKFKSIDSTANFYGAEFHSEADFTGATFDSTVNFFMTKFYSKAGFGLSDFKNDTEFLGVQFLSDQYSTALYELCSWDEISTYPEKLKVKIPILREMGLYLPMDVERIEHRNNGKQIKLVSSNEKEQSSVLLSLNNEQNQLIMNIIGSDKSYNFVVKENEKNLKIYKSSLVASIRFDYSWFRKRVRFIGLSEDDPVKLNSVSFKGVDLSLAEFHNVQWSVQNGFFINRTVVIDENLLDSYGNYKEVSKIYNQLRKNYESKLLFTEASHFFVGEMEAIRKSLAKSKAIKDKIAWIGYSAYKWLGLYGESTALPLFVWTPFIIGLFVVMRLLFFNETCSLKFEGKLPGGTTCMITDHIVDSLAAYFQFPRSGGHVMDTIERMISIPILGAAFIAIRRRFERIK